MKYDRRTLRSLPFSPISVVVRHSLLSLTVISWMTLVLIRGLLTAPYLCYINSTVLMLYGKAIKVEEGDDEVTVLRKARGYILQLIGGIVLPDQSNSHVHLCFLSLLDDLQLAGTYSWGSACVATLYHYLDFGSTVGSKNLRGMFVLLQVWGWERFPFLAPACNGKQVIRRDSSLSGWWDDEFHSPNLPTHVGHYRFSLDVQRPDEVVWQPYTDYLIQSLSRFCSAGRGVWMASVLLIQFSHVEQHHPERVNGAKDWSKPTRLWNDRTNNIVNITDPDILVYPVDVPYLDWYERITCEEGVHQQNRPLPQHQPQGPLEDTHVEYQFEEPIATSSSGGPVHPSELSTPFSSTILNMDGVSISPLLNYSPTAGVAFEEEKDGRVVGWGFTRPSHTAHRDNNSVRGDTRGGGGEEEEVDMEGGGHVTPDGPRRTLRVSRPPRCDLEQHILATGATNVGNKYIPSKVRKMKLLRVGRLPSMVMKITYAFPTLSFPHTMYTYIGVEVVDDNGINIIFDVADGIFDDMHKDSTILEQHNDYVVHDSAFDNNLGDEDDVSQSSEEDVDEGLEAEDHEEHEIPEFEPPSSMFIDDTWTNIMDPSPQMPTKSHVGWDGHCELFKR
ncbi:hypothetical protein RHSIM_Rhsim01G0142300 [Rhododendron simsii]|uniref:Aminotransferase-like plant mobile domain-containing protein n=1 Tax=Rhododendron simsii TaxID=118357 RepID=A0A834HHW1_RHOSS|nr:hypothetical protein RHSIM_Rhsim01G0142300 [Rhododendron simsii]